MNMSILVDCWAGKSVGLSSATLPTAHLAVVPLLSMIASAPNLVRACRPLRRKRHVDQQNVSTGIVAQRSAIPTQAEVDRSLLFSATSDRAPYQNGLITPPHPQGDLWRADHAN